MEARYFVLRLNPEPWAIGDVSAGRKDGRLTGRISPNANLQAFQSAVKEELEGVEPLPEGEYKITFYLWRQVAKYLDTGDRVRSRNQADATNIQKGLEDALQGVLFKNDRDVREVRTVIISQSHDTVSAILIKAEMFSLRSVIYEVGEIPKTVLKELDAPVVKKSDNVWRGPNG